MSELLEIKYKSLLKKNLKNFEKIVDCFFLRKDLYYWNYDSEYCKFIKKLKKIIKN